jgi:hypothetical protein
MKPIYSSLANQITGKKERSVLLKVLYCYSEKCSLKVPLPLSLSLSLFVFLEEEQ